MGAGRGLVQESMTPTFSSEGPDRDTWDQGCLPRCWALSCSWAGPAWAGRPCWPLGRCARWSRQWGRTGPSRCRRGPRHLCAAGGGTGWATSASQPSRKGKGSCFGTGWTRSTWCSAETWSVTRRLLPASGAKEEKCQWLVCPCHPWSILSTSMKPSIGASAEPVLDSDACEGDWEWASGFIFKCWVEVSLYASEMSLPTTLTQLMTYVIFHWQSKGQAGVTCSAHWPVNLTTCGNHIPDLCWRVSPPTLHLDPIFASEDSIRTITSLPWSLPHSGTLHLFSHHPASIFPESGLKDASLFTVHLAAPHLFFYPFWSDFCPYFFALSDQIGFFQATKSNSCFFSPKVTVPLSCL